MALFCDSLYAGDALPRAAVNSGFRQDLTGTKPFLSPLAGIPHVPRRHVNPRTETGTSLIGRITIRSFAQIIDEYSSSRTIGSRLHGRSLACSCQTCGWKPFSRSNTRTTPNALELVTYPCIRGFRFWLVK